MIRKLFLLLVMVSVAAPATGQDYQRPVPNLEVLVPELFGQQEEATIAYEDIYENLFLFYQHPLNLNTATADELTTLFILTPVQIQALLHHLKINGNLLSVYELQSIPGYDLLTIQRLLSFVTVEETGIGTSSKKLLQRIRNSHNQYFLTRYDRILQQKKGFTLPDTIGTRLTTRYAGSPDKLLLRYRNTHAQDFSIGFTAEKDAGEALRWQPATHQYGADFYSAHLQVYNQGRFKTIALGDYQLQFGQGLLLSSGFFIGKGSETITTTRRSNVGIRPFSSVLESGFFRGGAATYRLYKNLAATGFISRKKVDGTLSTASDTTAEGDFAFSGIQASGLHRTPTELARKHQIGEQIVGSNVSFKNRNGNFVAGLTVVQTNYQNPIQKRAAPYNTFEFAGHQNRVLGINYSYQWQNINFFGETGRSAGGGTGTINGLLASLSRQVDVAFIYRNYSRNFHSFYGQAFGENTRNSNEAGFYTGLKIKPAIGWEITAYADHFRFPWLKYRVDAPSRGTEYLLRVLYKPNKTALLYVQFRQETKGLNLKTAPRQLAEVVPATRQNYLVYLDFSPLPALNLRSRVQFSQYQHGQPYTSGYYISQEVVGSHRHTNISIRYALFDTDNYENRQYVTERDVLYAFSVPAFSGVGTRAYLLVQQNISRHLEGWVRLAHTQYRHQQTIGSGLEEIKGAARSELKCQLRYRW